MFLSAALGGSPRALGTLGKSRPRQGSGLALQLAGILQQCAIGLLLGPFLFHRRFSIDLSHQVIENLVDVDL